MATSCPARSLDVKDRRILYELDVDARATLLRVAKRVGISKDAVKYRIGNLVSSGVAKGFIAVIDTARLGYTTFGVFMKFREVSPRKEKEIIDYLTSNPRIGWAVSCEGSWDLNMWYWATSIYDFEDFWKDFLSKYRKYVARSWIHVATKLHHYRRKYLLSGIREAEGAGVKAVSAAEVLGGGREKVEVDELDMKILRILVVNARTPLIEIAEKVGASPKVVAYRIENLVKRRVILFFRVVLNLEKAGYLYYKLHLYLRDMDGEKFASLMEYCRRQPNVMYVDEKIGGADFELELHVESPEKFREIVADMRSRFSAIISDHESLLYYKEHKLAYLPTG